MTAELHSLRRKMASGLVSPTPRFSTRHGALENAGVLPCGPHAGLDRKRERP